MQNHNCEVSVNAAFVTDVNLHQQADKLIKQASESNAKRYKRFQYK